jgi:GTP:adenosylcobinamide-phosphate guanylyltransferase
MDGVRLNDSRRPTFTALVLAGRRGPSDTLAGSGAILHKALLPVAGVPMLVRVLRTLERARHVGQILVAIDDASVLDVPELRALADRGTVRRVDCGRSPSTTVSGYLARGGVTLPLLVTTADHPLLVPEMVDHFCEAASRLGGDVAVGAVSAVVFRAHYPEARRTVIRLRGEGFSGANLFAFMTPGSRRAAEFWVRAEQFRKRPWRLVSVFGPMTLALFLLRRLDLESALARVSRAIGCDVRLVQMPFADCAIDVDGTSDLALASRILEAREGRSQTVAPGDDPRGATRDTSPR